ncbi:MAG TPA: RidA family protein [Dehalococcoidia bacterium]|nr:RidA family protein [Dehalococcoidia bacterium]
MTQLQRTVINASTAPQPIGAYSQAVWVNAGELLFIAGQVALDSSGNLVGQGDVAAQTRQVFHNIGQILDRAGATFHNVAEFTTYLVGRDSIQPFLSARTELFPTLFPGGDYPPNTLLIIDSLVREESLVEIKAVAALP